MQRGSALSRSRAYCEPVTAPEVSGTQGARGLSNRRSRFRSRLKKTDSHLAGPFRRSMPCIVDPADPTVLLLSQMKHVMLLLETQ